jgi:UDPglucose 6-dehydrogenase
MKTVSVIGLWHLGLVNTVGFAEKGYKVNAIEFDKTKIEQLQKINLPLFEPGLEERVKKYLGLKTLTFTNDPTAVKDSDFAVIAYDSPVDEKDQVDISPVVKAAELISPYLKLTTPVIITSQVPLGTCEKIEENVKKINPRWKSGVIYVPENLRLGNAIDIFLKPDMIVLGARVDLAKKSALNLYKPFKTKKFLMDLRSAEMVKHALNAFLATSITFGNEIANLADRLGADAVAVGTALKSDQRIGKAPIMPGLGFSGGTLARDVEQLKKFARNLKYKAPLLKSITEINEGTFDEVIAKLEKRTGQLKGKKIGILGLTYKPGTSTMKRSPAIKVINKLLAKKAYCLAYDPKASLAELKTYAKEVKKEKTIEDLVKKSDALVLVTEWPEFQNLDFKKLAKIMKTPILIDAKNFLDPAVLNSSGFDYEGYGRGILKGGHQ